MVGIRAKDSSGKLFTFFYECKQFSVDHGKCFLLLKFSIVPNIE